MFRLFHLTRSIDLARTFLSIPLQDHEAFLLLRRKGASKATWEKIMKLDQQAISPFHLILRYVELTRHIATPGTALLRSLSPPYAPLSANSVGRITKNALSRMGVPIKVFGPHSTRGAGVKFFKSLGLTSEEVCEIGKWKNPQTFTANYLRLGAVDRLASALGGRVRTASPVDSAEPDRSRTPRTPQGGGRRKE